MEEIKERLSILAQQSKALEPDVVERQQLIKELTSYIDDFIYHTEIKPTYFVGQPNNKLLKVETKDTLSNLLHIYTKEVVEKGINPASGGHIGYIPGGGIYTAALGDLLADITNEYAGMYFASPGAVTIENELINWLKTIFDFPESTIGNLTSGGSIANLIALTAARDKHGVKNEKITKSVIYMSNQVHHCVNKSLRIIGLEDVQVRYIQLDKFSRINSKDLSHQIANDKANGLHPFMVIASAGTTDTGAIDPLFEIGQVCKKHNLWYHVDAAYGGFFILCKDKKEAFKGIKMADSLVVDPHKGLFLPYGIGAVLVKDKNAVFHSHHYTANYMQDATTNEQINPADVSPELTKHFRGLRMWIPLKLHGISPFIACLEEKLVLTAYFRIKLKDLGFNLGPKPDLSVSYFWYPTNLVDENVFNQKLMEIIHHNGSVFLSSTKIDNKFVIRMAILSFRTKKETIDKAILMIKDSLNKTVEFFNEVKHDIS